jgi:hypothetical protein
LIDDLGRCLKILLRDLESLFVGSIPTRSSDDLAYLPSASRSIPQFPGFQRPQPDQRFAPEILYA